MDKYNYYEVMKENIREVLESEYDIDTMRYSKDSIYDDLFVNDSVTGNGSGSYTFNTEKAKEYVLDNLDLLDKAITEFSIDMNEHYSDWEYLDVSIRCYLLGEVFYEVLEEILENKEEEEEE